MSIFLNNVRTVSGELQSLARPGINLFRQMLSGKFGIHPFFSLMLQVVLQVVCLSAIVGVSGIALLVGTAVLVLVHLAASLMILAIAFSMWPRTAGSFGDERSIKAAAKYLSSRTTHALFVGGVFLLLPSIVAGLVGMPMLHAAGVGLLSVGALALLFRSGSWAQVGRGVPEGDLIDYAKFSFFYAGAFSLFFGGAAITGFGFALSTALAIVISSLAGAAIDVVPMVEAVSRIREEQAKEQ